jgi:hypothetical protein
MYTWRASYLPILNVDSQYVYSPNQNFDMLRHGLAEWDSLKHLLLKDFYVLTPWHAPNDKQGFTAYAFYDPDAREGVLLAFRMEDCACDTLSLTLPFAGKDEAFLLTNADDGSSIQTTGSFTLTLPHPRCAQLYRIRAGASM